MNEFDKIVRGDGSRGRSKAYHSPRHAKARAVLVGVAARYVYEWVKLVFRKVYSNG